VSRAFKSGLIGGGIIFLAVEFQELRHSIGALRDSVGSCKEYFNSVFSAESCLSHLSAETLDSILLNGVLVWVAAAAILGGAVAAVRKLKPKSSEFFSEDRFEDIAAASKIWSEARARREVKKLKVELREALSAIEKRDAIIEALSTQLVVARNQLEEALLKRSPRKK
jgi:hypothetical protein